MKGGHRTDIRAVRGLGLRETPLSIVRLLWVPAGKSEALASLWWPQNSGSFFGGGGAVVPVGSSLREARVAEPPPHTGNPFIAVRHHFFVLTWNIVSGLHLERNHTVR